MARPVVDFPHPDSPTRPSVSLFSTKKSIPSTARTAPTCRWKMIPCVRGKCILSAFTSSRFRPLSAVAVLRMRTNSGLAGVTAIWSPLAHRRRGWRHLGLRCAHRLDRQLRDLLFDLFEHSYVPDLAAPVGVDEPTTRLRAPAARLVIGLGVGNRLEL